MSRAGGLVADHPRPFGCSSLALLCTLSTAPILESSVKHLVRVWFPLEYTRVPDTPLHQRRSLLSPRHLTARGTACLSQSSSRAPPLPLHFTAHATPGPLSLLNALVPRARVPLATEHLTHPSLFSPRAELLSLSLFDEIVVHTGRTPVKVAAVSVDRFSPFLSP